MIWAMSESATPTWPMSNERFQPAETETGTLVHLREADISLSVLFEAKGLAG